MEFQRSHRHGCLDKVIPYEQGQKISRALDRERHQGGQTTPKALKLRPRL
jgi:hypothetical protein